MESLQPDSTHLNLIEKAQDEFFTAAYREF